jgi:hypothetical protein
VIARQSLDKVARHQSGGAGDKNFHSAEL